MIPRLEASVEKVGYNVALEKITGRPKGKMKRPGLVVGATVKNLFPMGQRLSAAERNTMIQNCPRKALTGVAICMDYNAHSGCQRGAQCNYVHDFIGGKNLHWCVEAELLRRGGFRKRKNMLKDPVEIDVLVKELREANVKQLGEQKKGDAMVQPAGKSLMTTELNRGAGSAGEDPKPDEAERFTDAKVLSWEADPTWVDYTRSVMNKNVS